MNAHFGVVSLFSSSSTRRTGVDVIVFNQNLLPGSFCQCDVDGRVMFLSFSSVLNAIVKLTYMGQPSLLSVPLALMFSARAESGPTFLFSVEVLIAFATPPTMFGALTKGGRLGMRAS